MLSSETHFLSPSLSLPFGGRFFLSRSFERRSARFGGHGGLALRPVARPLEVHVPVRVNVEDRPPGALDVDLRPHVPAVAGDDDCVALAVLLLGHVAHRRARGDAQRTEEHHRGVREVDAVAAQALLVRAALVRGVVRRAPEHVRRGVGALVLGGDRVREELLEAELHREGLGEEVVFPARVGQVLGDELLRELLVPRVVGGLRVVRAKVGRPLRIAELGAEEVGEGHVLHERGGVVATLERGGGLERLVVDGALEREHRGLRLEEAESRS